MLLSMCTVNEIVRFIFDKWRKKLPNSPKLNPPKLPLVHFIGFSFIFSLSLTCSGTLARLIDFLLSPLFLHTYSDAITLGSISMNITPQAKKLIEKPFPQSPQIHISRVDTFLLLLEALSFSVQRLVLSLSS